MHALVTTHQSRSRQPCKQHQSGSPSLGCSENANGQGSSGHGGKRLRLTSTWRANQMATWVLGRRVSGATIQRPIVQRWVTGKSVKMLPRSPYYPFYYPEYSLPESVTIYQFTPTAHRRG